MVGHLMIYKMPLIDTPREKKDEAISMKIYVMYVLSDYAHAVYVSTKKQLCEQEIREYIKRGGDRPTWIEEYDFSKAEAFELDCD